MTDMRRKKIYVVVDVLCVLVGKSIFYCLKNLKDISKIGNRRVLS